MNPLPATAAACAASPAPSLAQASRALWLATLSLMTAFMQQPAPAHRYLLARRIARNLRTLGELECFSADNRRRFTRLGRHWQARADRLAPDAPAAAALPWWQSVLKSLRRPG